MSAFLGDLRFALRGLARTPRVTVVVVLTLALGIGATAAVFSVVDAVLLERLPYDRPEQLFMVDTTYHSPRGGIEPQPTSWLDFRDWQQRMRGFQGLAAVSNPRSFHLRVEGEVQRLTGELITAEYLPVLGIRPVVGRTFTEAEVLPPGRRVVLLGHGLWRSRFGADPAVVGRVLRLNDEPYEVVGVLPEGFRGLTDQAEVWAPTGLAGALLGKPYLEMRKLRWLNVLGRLGPGVTARRAGAEAAAVTRDLEREFPAENQGIGARLTSLSETLFGDLRPTLLALLAGAAFVLLIACANVASLLLARTAVRGREMAIRSALGAGRARLMGQLLTESVLLALLGGVLGLLLARWIIRPLTAASGIQLQSFVDPGLHPRVVAVVLALTVLCGVGFGLVPALFLSRTRGLEALKDQGRSSSAGRGRQRFQSSLVVAEIALALVLLLGDGLMILGYQHLRSLDLGVRTDNVATLRLDLSGPQWNEDPPIYSLARNILERTRSLPGVASAALGGPDVISDGAPLSFFTIEDTRGAGLVTLQVHSVSPGYFATLGIPVLAGRPLGFEDVSGAPPAIAISRALARRYWPDGKAVGRRMKVGDNDSPFPWFTIVGVVGEVRHQGLTADEAPAPDVYFSMLQFPPRLPPRLAVLVRAATPGGSSSDRAAALLPRLRAELRDAAPGLAPYDEATLESRLRQQTSRGQFLILLTSLFAVLALILAVIGIYGMVSYAVARRTREIAIRVTLGADRWGVLRLILGWGATLVLIGTVLGIAGALTLTRFLASLLYGFSPRDPLTFLGVPLVLLAVALLACYLPARRALAIEPETAMRAE
jgi:putative ABC transport system permease protein